MEQIAMLEEFGADMNKVIIGHLGDRIGVHHLLPIAEKGVYLEVDNIGYLDYQPEYVRADNVAALVKEGFADRVLLSEDICMLNHLKYTGGKGYGYLLETFVPLLRERGVTDEQIHQMMVVESCKSLFAETSRCRLKCLFAFRHSSDHQLRGLCNSCQRKLSASGCDCRDGRGQQSVFRNRRSADCREQLIQEARERKSGIVTCGAAGGLTLAAAACLAGNHPDIMDQLPDVSGCARNEIIYPLPGPFDYDHAIRLSGAKLISIDYRAPDALQQIELAITPRTAAIGFVWLRVDEQPDFGNWPSWLIGMDFR